jgi:hypothetical protein
MLPIPLDKLVTSRDGLTESVSHVQWVRDFDRLVGTTWKLTTNAGTTFAIEPGTGSVATVASSPQGSPANTK